ncbi:hypothetical protein YC2023_083905 [Brassica napus]
MFGHIGRSPSFDVGTTGVLSLRSFLGIVCRVLCQQQVRNLPMLGMFWDGLVFPRPRIQRDCGLSRGDPMDSGPRSVESSFFWPFVVLTLSPNSGLGTESGLFPLLEARSWQEAKSNLVTVALGMDDRIAGCWTPGLVSNYINVAKLCALTQQDELVDELV